jgi:DNA-directed RNA polymerase subunit M/transcription elongation factor TFIIS
MTGGEDMSGESETPENPIVCNDPCGSILDYYVDRDEQKLLKKCTTCQRTYIIPPEHYVISTKNYYQTGENTSNEIIDFNRIMADPTIMKVRYDCKQCKKQTIAKTWRNDHTMIANYICSVCKMHFQ